MEDGHGAEDRELLINEVGDDDGQPQPSAESRVAIIGPFSPVLTLSGFDVEHSLVGKRERLCRALFSTIIFIAFVVGIVWRLITLFSVAARPFSHDWAVSNFGGFFAVHALGSAGAMLGWSRTGSFSKLYTALTACLPKEHTTPLLIGKRFLAAGFFSVAYIAIAMAASANTSVERMKKARANGTDDSFFAKDNMFGAEPAIAFISAFATVLALTIYASMQGVVSKQIKAMNDDIEAASMRGELGVGPQNNDHRRSYNDLPCTFYPFLMLLFPSSAFTKEARRLPYFQQSLEKLSDRQIPVLKAAALLVEETKDFASVSAIAAVLANINVLYVVMALSGDVPLFPYIITILGVQASAGLIVATLFPPATLQSELNRSSYLLLSDKHVSKDAAQRALAQLMVRRIDAAPTKIPLLNAFPVGELTPHITFFIAPNAAALLSVVYRAITYKD